METVSLPSILMALSRMKFSSKAQQMTAHDLAYSITDLSVRSHLCEYTFLNSPSLSKVHLKLAQRKISDPDMVLNFSQGVKESTLIISERYSSDVLNNTESESITRQLQNVSLIIMHLPEPSSEISGVYYPILQALAWDHIPFVEIISVSDELSILFENEFVDKAFSCLKGLTR